MNIELCYEQRGDVDAPPVVFIHGSYATEATWKAMVERLAPCHHCILIKLPGHGGTPDPKDFTNPSMETELSLIERVVDKLCHQPIHLVGHSFGGVVALAQAFKGSLSVSELTLFEPVTVNVLELMQDPEMAQDVHTFLAQYRRDVARNVPQVCSQLINFWGGEGAFDLFPDYIKKGMEGLVDNNIRHWDLCVNSDYTLADLKKFPIPTRVVCGSESNPATRAIATVLTDNIACAHKTVIEGASHFLVNSHVDECLSALQDKNFFDS